MRSLIKAVVATVLVGLLAAPVIAQDDTTAPELLPDVDLVTEEVEPGVYRVLTDGVRDLDRLADRKKDRSPAILDGNVVAGLDGSVWWFEPDGFFRLGDVSVHRWPEGLSDFFRLGRADIEVGTDGTIWVAGHNVIKKVRDEILSYDGQAWTSRWRGAKGKRSVYGVAVQQDGSVWMAWYKQGPKGYRGVVRAARLGDDGWEVLPGKVATAKDRPPAFDGDMVVAEGGGSDVWLKSGFSERLRRYDGEDWIVVRTPEAGGEQRVAVGPDGTLWVRLHPDCGPGTAGDQPGTACGGPSDILARFDGEEWEVFDSSDGIPRMGDHYQGFDGFFDVAPDRSVWFNPIGDWERTGTECDGVASFDGEAVTSFLRDTCIYAMDLAPDGTVWLQAGEWRADLASGEGLGDAQPGPIHTYVIDVEALSAAE